MVADPRALQLSTAVGSDRGASSPLTPRLLQHADFLAAARLIDWRGFHSELQRAAIAATQTGAPLSLLMLERVAWNPVDQPSGSGVAASALGALAGAVKAAVGARAVLGRYGEGRLAVILIDTDLGQAVGMAELIADQISPPGCRAAGGVDLETAAAIGIAQFDDDEALSHLIHWTAQALKQARTQRGLAVVADHSPRKRPSRVLRPVGSPRLMPSVTAGGDEGSAA